MIPTKACRRRWWVFCPVLISSETRGQESLWEAYQSAGVKALQEGRNVEAERLFMAAIGRAEQFGKQDLRLAQTLCDLGMHSAPQGKKLEAEPLFRRSLEIIQGTMGPRHPNTASPLRRRGILCAAQGKFVQRLKLFSAKPSQSILHPLSRIILKSPLA